MMRRSLFRCVGELNTVCIVVSEAKSGACVDSQVSCGVEHAVLGATNRSPAEGLQLYSLIAV